MNIGIGLQSGWGLERNVLCPVVQHMDDYLHDQLADRQYGGEIDEFVVMAYAVFPEQQMNRFFAQMTHEIQSEQNVYDHHALVHSLVFTLPFQPEHLAHMGYEEFRDVFCKAIVKCLDQPNLEISQQFHYEKFKADVKSVLGKYLQKPM